MILGDKIVIGVSLLGGFNFFLFWFNVVLLLFMDGGYIVGVIYEVGKWGLFKFVRKFDFGLVDIVMMLLVVWIIGVFMFMMGFVFVVVDVVLLVKIF